SLRQEIDMTSGMWGNYHEKIQGKKPNSVGKREAHTPNSELRFEDAEIFEQKNRLSADWSLRAIFSN
ncbi:MAG TPA: hypothetical protein DEG17_20215, partial [Cyanobacteria bacterium UBA11149]|nr:hypothetical protein [Cyanobacteria bacterium UBA11149]